MAVKVQRPAVLESLPMTGGGNSNLFFFTPKLGEKIPNLTSIFDHF